MFAQTRERGPPLEAEQAEAHQSLSSRGSLVGLPGRLMHKPMWHLKVGSFVWVCAAAFTGTAQNPEEQIISFVKHFVAAAMQKITGSSVLIMLLKSATHVE